MSDSSLCLHELWSLGSCSTWTGCMHLYLSRNMSGSGGYVVMSGTRSCTMTMTKDVNPNTKKTYKELMTVFHTSGSNLPARCCRHLPLECVWHSAAPEPYPGLSPFLSRSSFPLQERSPPLYLLSAPSQLHSTPTAFTESPAGRPSVSRRPSSSSWPRFCLWSRRRAMVNLLMSPSTARPSGGPRRSASVRASRLRPSRRCRVHNNSTYSTKPSSCSHRATSLQLQALTVSSDGAMSLQIHTCTVLSQGGLDN